MEKLPRIFRFVGSILFVLLGVYILRTNVTTLGKIIGIACIMFFGGLMIFRGYKLNKESNPK